MTRVTPHQIKPCFNILHVFTELNDNVIYYITSTLTYIITTVSKVETDITASFSTRPNERDVILVVMYVETFNTDVIVFIGVKDHNVTSN